MVKSKKQNQKELEAIGALEGKFKELGKFLYACYKDNQDHNFELIMKEFDRDIVRLLKRLS